jgi:hypothetical protein
LLLANLCLAQTCHDIDFNTDSAGNSLAHGVNVGIDDATQYWKDWGVTVTTTNPNKPLRLFWSEGDKNSPQFGEDPDLMTPNDAFGGAGHSNDGSGSSGPGVNDVGRGNVLIINKSGPSTPADATNDEAGGGLIIFTFENPMTIYGMGMVDADQGETESYFTAYDENGNVLVEHNLLALGDNSYQYIFFNQNNNLAGLSDVKRLEVKLDSSGSISGFDMCPPTEALAAIGDTVWWDYDRDAVLDPGEPGLEGVLVVARYCGETKTIASAVTDSTGYYIISSLPPACYEVYVFDWNTNTQTITVGGEEFFHTSTPEEYLNINLQGDDFFPDADFGYDNDECPTPNDPDDTCNNIDDNCNGQTDEGFQNTVTTCGYGVCRSEGELQCVAGIVSDTCEEKSKDSNNDATCDGLDNDCDNEVDEDYTETSTSCGLGVCANSGTKKCVGGVEQDDCEPKDKDSEFDTICDGKDNDCDGAVDEEYVPTKTTCGQGSCASEGLLNCEKGVTVDTCKPGIPPAEFDRICDGLDEDCDGQVDEDYVSETITCGFGPCQRTIQTSCTNGVEDRTCTPGTAQSSEDDVCDGIDNDCDGDIDEDYSNDTVTACGDGVCQNTGKLICQDGEEIDTCTILDPTGTDNNCNGVDEDCNGVADDGYQPYATSCGVGVCATTGTSECVNGVESTGCAPLQPNSDDDSNCNNLDDNCNGSIDEDFKGRQTDCGVGVCTSTGTEVCINGSVVDTCTPADPTRTVDDTCNNIDEDCSGEADEDYNSLITYCGVGECAATGQTTCEGGEIVDSCTEGTPAESDDTCDGKDDNCNGLFDEDYSNDEVTECGIGACANEGSFVCVKGTVVDTCDELDPSGSDNTCDNIDNDCDGEVDEDYEITTTTCGVGACVSEGRRVCESGQEIDTCTPGTPAAGDATCNNIDDNCDGNVDEDYKRTRTECGVGACVSFGELVCIAGNVIDTCEPGTPADDDPCDGIDNDCDGDIDEDYVSTETTCGVGACSNTGKFICVDGNVIDSCETSDPSNQEVCNGVDDNCNGVVDEGYEPETVSCGVGVCATTSFTSCVNGIVDKTCTPLQPQSDIDDICDGLDNDCDGEIDEESFCVDDLACSVGSCTPNGCVQDYSICNATCHDCRDFTRGLVTVNSADVGSVNYRYTGEYVFRVTTSEQFLLREIHLGIVEDFSSGVPSEVTAQPFHVLDISSTYAEIEVPSPTTCGEDHFIMFIALVERVSTGETLLAYMFGDLETEEFNFPIVTSHRACCNPSACPACVLNSQCDDGNPCTVEVCENDQCQVSETVCPGPVPPPEEPPVEPPTEQPATPTGGDAPAPGPPPATGVTQQNNVPNAAPGADPIDDQAEVVVAGTSSTFVVGGIGAGVVGFFAFFGAVVGLNNTKKDADVPLSAVLEDPEAATSAFINPTFQGANEANINVAAS